MYRSCHISSCACSLIFIVFVAIPIFVKSHTHTHCVFECVSVCVCVRESVCVCERERHTHRHTHIKLGSHFSFRNLKEISERKMWAHFSFRKFIYFVLANCGVRKKRWIFQVVKNWIFQVVEKKTAERRIWRKNLDEFSKFSKNSEIFRKFTYFLLVTSAFQI